MTGVVAVPWALLFSLAALAVAAYGLYRSMALGRALERVAGRVDELASELEALRPDVRMVKRALAAVLAGREAEELVRELRRRRRRRYIVFYVVYEGDTPPQPEELEKAIIRAVERLAGQLTVAKSRLQLVYYDPVRGAGILRATHDTKYLVLAGMALVRMVAGKRVVLVPVRTTGTIKTARRALALPRR